MRKSRILSFPETMCLWINIANVKQPAIHSIVMSLGDWKVNRGWGKNGQWESKSSWNTSKANNHRKPKNKLSWNISKANSHRKQKKQFSGKTDKANHHSTPPARQILMKHPKEHLTHYFICPITYCCNNCRKFLIADFAQSLLNKGSWKSTLRINMKHQHITLFESPNRKTRIQGSCSHGFLKECVWHTKYEKTQNFFLVLSFFITVCFFAANILNTSAVVTDSNITSLS